MDETAVVDATNGTSGSTPAKEQKVQEDPLTPHAPQSTHSSEGLSTRGKPDKAKERRLRAYIASFRAGQTPPCRSYRSLIVLHEFEQFTQKLEIADSAVSDMIMNMPLREHDHLL